MDGGDGGADGGDGGDEGEEEVGEKEESSELEEAESVGAWLLPDVTRLEARVGAEGNDFEVVDVGLEAVGG